MDINHTRPMIAEGAQKVSVNPVSSIVELAIHKGASVALAPVSARKQLFDLSDDMATKVNVLFYTDARDAFIKAVAD